MIEFLIWTTGAVAILSLLAAHRRHRDPLHPLMFLGPMMFYMYAWRPATLYYQGIFTEYFHNESDLAYALTVNLLSVTAFCFGCLRERLPSKLKPMLSEPFVPSAKLSRRLFSLSLLFGILGVAAFLVIVYSSGGFAAAYGSAKGGGRAASGYLGDGQILTLPAILLLVLSMQGKRWRPRTVGLLLLYATPYLIIGTLGARRGPVFSILICLLIPWFLASGKRPSMRSFLAALLFVGVIVTVLFTYRRQIYIGSDAEFDPDRLKEALYPVRQDVMTGDTTIFSAGLILASRHHAHHFWGGRYAVVLLVRPIPRQLWPTKYADTGMGWMGDRLRPAGMTMRKWYDALGWFPQTGAASGFAADMYLEFAWGGARGMLPHGTHVQPPVASQRHTEGRVGHPLCGGLYSVHLRAHAKCPCVPASFSLYGPSHAGRVGNTPAPT